MLRDVSKQPFLTEYMASSNIRLLRLPFFDAKAVLKYGINHLFTLNI